MIVTFSFGLWMFPTFLTVSVLLHMLFMPPTPDHSDGRIMLYFGLVCSIITAWTMWGLSWLV